MSTEPVGTAAAGAAGAGSDASRSQGELRAEAARARAQLASTLDAIEYKLNLRRQAKVTTRRVSLGLHRLGEDNPLALVGVAVGAAVVTGTAVWLTVRPLLRR